MGHEFRPREIGRQTRGRQTGFDCVFRDAGGTLFLSCRVYKGRHVLLGDQVKDGQFDAAEFQDLGSAPPTMMAARIIDLWSLQYGFILTQSDATSAYTQEFIGGGRGKGVPTWLSLPRHRWPPEWEGRFVHPVVLLILALYGHPDAGAFWERKCEGALLSCGWTKTCWQGLFTVSYTHLTLPTKA